MLRDFGDLPDVPCVPGPLDTFEAALEDDLNFAGAIAELFRLAKAARQARTAADRAAYEAALRDAGGLLGLLQEDPRGLVRTARRRGRRDGTDPAAGRGAAGRSIGT